MFAGSSDLTVHGRNRPLKARLDLDVHARLGRRSGGGRHARVGSAGGNRLGRRSGRGNRARRSSAGGWGSSLGTASLGRERARVDVREDAGRGK